MIDESLLWQKRYFCPVCMISEFTFDKPEMNKIKVSLSDYNNMITDITTGHSVPAIKNYYRIECYGCGFNFMVEVGG